MVVCMVFMCIFAIKLQKLTFSCINLKQEVVMIIDFTISNFRSIREAQTISFEATSDLHLEDSYVINKGEYRLLKIAMVLGANASGKSNVLRAFEMLPVLLLQPCENKTSQIKYDKFALDPLYRNKDSEIKVNFICGQTRYSYEVGFNNLSVTRELLKAKPFGALRDHKIYERFTDESKLVSSIKWGEYEGKKYVPSGLARDLKTTLLHNRTLFGAYLNSNVNISWIQEIIDWLGSYMMPIVKTTNQHLDSFTSEQIYEQIIKKEQVAELLRRADVGIRDFELEKKSEAIPPKIIDFMLKDDRLSDEEKKRLTDHPFTDDIVVKMIHDGAQEGIPMDFQQESNGTKRYYELSSILLKLVQDSHFVAIDELECRLHPDLYEFFILTYLKNSHESQMIFTTHMREFLADKDLFRDDCVWFTEKNREGATSLYSLADFDSSVLRQVSSRYNAYKSGRLGAVPYVGDTYIDTNKNDGDHE